MARKRARRHGKMTEYVIVSLEILLAQDQEERSAVENQMRKRKANYLRRCCEDSIDELFSLRIICAL
jgi:hypothetical protein